VIRVEKSTIVHRPSDEVFAFVADQLNAPRWQSGIVEVRRLTDGPPGVGTRHTFTRTLMGRRMSGENEYVAFEPGKRVVFRTTSGPRLVASYVVTPITEGTRLTTTMEVDFSGIMSLAEPLVGRALTRDVVAALARLTSILESSPTAGLAKTQAAGRVSPS
jgi:uncharacterized protein YndB with AHSA1/START domain